MKNRLKLLAEYAKRTSELKFHNAIAEGYYKIEEILTNDSKGNYTILKVNASWHPTDKTVSQGSYSVTVSLNALFSRISSGPKEINPNAMLGSIINVKKVELHTYEWEKEEKSTIKIDWEIVSFAEQPTILLESN
jgi:hypothetical protein